MTQNVRKLPLWARSGIISGLLGMVVTFVKAAESFTHPFAILLVVVTIIGSVVYSIR